MAYGLPYLGIYANQILYDHTEKRERDSRTILEGIRVAEVVKPLISTDNPEQYALAFTRGESLAVLWSSAPLTKSLFDHTTTELADLNTLRLLTVQPSSRRSPLGKIGDSRQENNILLYTQEGNMVRKPVTPEPEYYYTLPEHTVLLENKITDFLKRARYSEGNEKAFSVAQLVRLFGNNYRAAAMRSR